jgi:hypothetical protein
MLYKENNRYVQLLKIERKQTFTVEIKKIPKYKWRSLAVPRGGSYWDL